jgi:ribonuclease G
MSGNLLVINVDIREIRVALIEKGVIAELHIERLSSRNTLGNVCLGAVSRVLPGMQAAFIDIGEERAAFLHVEDLIRPDDFEAYLSGSRDQGELALDAEEVELEDAVPEVADKPSGDEVAGVNGATDLDSEVTLDEDPSLDVIVAPHPQGGGNGFASAAADDSTAPLDSVGSELDSTASDLDSTASELDSTVSELESAVPDPSTPGSSGAPSSLRAGSSGESEMPLESLAPGDEPEARAEATVGGGRVGRKRRRARRARVARSSRATSRVSKPPPAGDKDKRGRRGRNDKRRGAAGRITKSTPIREVVREGQHVIVQVTKEPIGTKGARVSSHISLPGRYVVYLPTVDHVGISKRIGSEKERARLRASIEAMKPPKGGFVVRTVAEGLTKKQLKNDIGYLVRLWDEIAKKREETRKAPCVLYEELDLVLKTARDLFTEEVDRIVIDNREQYSRLKRFVQMFMPERAGDITLYEGREPVFDAYGIEDEIGRALARKVPLSSGGYLIIDQAEALTAIDVNTGRYVGKGQKDLEDTILQTNLEAVEEIAYQLRFRNIGGLIILDLIDMERPSNREKVRRRLGELLAKDKAKTTINRISDLGLIEMTRKRTRESLGRLLHEPCFYCDGTGQLMSKETIAYEILRQIRREQSGLKGYRITVNAHPAIIDLLKSEEREAVQEAERMFARRIELVPKKEYHIEQFDLQGL